MSTFVVITTLLATDVANAGTFAVSYPTGHTGGDFIGGVEHKLVVNQREYDCPTDFTVAFGAATATITWNGGYTLEAGSQVRVQLDQAGTGQLGNGITRAQPASVVRVELGTPATSDDDYFRAAASISGAGALTLLLNDLDVPRNVIVTSAGNDTGVTFTVVGEDEYGEAVSEVITGANAGVAAGKKAFKTISSITASGASAGTVKVGFGNVLGLPIFIHGTGNIIGEFLDNAPATAGTKVAGLAPTTKSTTTTADVRGTYVPNSAPNGSRTYSLLLAVANPTHLGNPQA